jgi:asparagine synthase (glutamine-hydrolysing)
VCGICGVAAADPAPGSRTAVVRAMLERLVHRGPDAEGVADDRGFAFGSRRLAVIDPAGGAQPMRTPDGRFTLVFNGAIYNYVELRDELEREGVRFRTSSDTEVLLQVLATRGQAALDRLNGMFAFALHDGDDGSVLLARDPLGIKPLYWTQTPDGELVFASEIKALLRHPDVVARRSDEALFQYLTFQLCLADATLFADVHELEPGFLLRFGGAAGGSPQLHRFWDLDFTVDFDHTPEYFEWRLDELLRDSVRLQLRSDVPLGCYLSGGLDSSLVGTLGAQLAGASIPAFHGRFAEEHYDESGFARAAADAAGMDLREVLPTPEDFVESMPSLIHHMDQPAGGPGLFPQYVVSRLAADSVTVALGGQGGDEVFGGYARYVIGYLEQALKGAVHGTQEEGRHIVTLESIVPNLAVLRDYVPLMRRFWAEGLFEPMDRRYFRLVDRFPDAEHLLEPEVLAGRREEALFEGFQAEFNRPDTPSYINKMTHFDLKTLLPALLHVEDRVSMAVSLESRVPLLDTRIVELVASMPPIVKFAGGQTKEALRAAAAGVLPPEIVRRQDKMGFPVPLSEWLRGGPVRDFVGDVVLSDRARTRGLFRADAVEALIGEEAPFGRELWGILCLELWHREFIDA